MKLPPSSLAAAPLLALLAASVNAQDPLVKTGDHFQLKCHFYNQKIADQAFETAEKAWKVTEELLGVEKEPQELFTVHLYRNRGDFEKAEEEITAGQNKETYGFANYDTRSAYVGIQGWLEEDYLNEYGLDNMTLGRIADACSRLARHELMPISRGRMQWLDDGVALKTTWKVLEDAGLVKKMENDPRYSTLLRVGVGMEAGRQIPEAPDLLAGDYKDLGAFNQAAANFLFFEFLTLPNNRRGLAKCLSELRELSPAAEDEEIQRVLIKELRAKRLDKPFWKWVRDLEPEWDEIYPELQMHPKGWMQVGLNESGAQTWKVEPAGPRPWVIQGKFTILKASAHQLNLFLGREGGSYAMLGFVAGDGVFVWEYQPSSKSWDELGSQKTDKIEVGKPVTFEVTWNQDRKRFLVVSLNGEEILRTKLIRGMAGQWGVGANWDSIGIWHELDIRN